MVDTGRAIWQWQQLAAADRRRLLKLARRGKPEPDRQVAQVGLDWAEAILATRAAPSGGWPRRVWAFLLSLVTGDAYADDVSERWIATKILRANRPTALAEPLNGKALWQAVHAVLLDELKFRACSAPLTFRPDRLEDFADHVADVIVGNFEVIPRDGPPVRQGKPIWIAVHAAMLDELRLRIGADPLTIEQDWLTEYAASLADVAVGRFELAPRPARR